MEATKQIRLFIKQNLPQLCMDLVAVNKAGCRKDVPTFDELYNLIESHGGGMTSMVTACMLIGTVSAEAIAEGDYVTKFFLQIH